MVRGDYDGDLAWICWEPAIVAPFKNSPVPPVPPLASYGIEKDNLKVADILKDTNYVGNFLRHAFHFNLQANMLGPCTLYHESLCYSGVSIEDPKAIAIAALLGQLVDRAKLGIQFNESHWQQYLQRNDLPRNPARPAYRDTKRTKWSMTNLIDRLVFVTAKKKTEEALHKLSVKFEEVGSWDDDLARPWKKERDLAKDDMALTEALKRMNAGLELIIDYWKKKTPKDERDERSKLPPFAAVVEKCRADFLNLAPTCPPETPQSSILRRWAREWENGRACCDWSLIKASALFVKKHPVKIAWHVAGIELAEIKATAAGRGTYRLVVGGIFRAMKINGKSVDRIRRRELKNVEVDGEDDDEDEYGGWDGDSVSDFASD